MTLSPTHNLQQVINLAFAAAEDLGFGELRPEHLLLGLLRKGACRAVHVLVNLHVELPLLEASLLHRLNQLGSDPTGGGMPALHDSTQMLYDTLVATTENMGLHQQGTDHLLYALLKHPEFPAAQLMAEHGLNAENLFREMLRFNNTTEIAAEMSDLLATARVMAGQAGAPAITVGNLLAALLEQPNSRAMRLLTGQGVEVDALRESVRAATRTSNRPATPPIGFELAAGQLLAEAEHLARQLAPVRLGPEHLLLTLMHSNSLAEQLLREFGVSYEMLFLQALVTSTRRRGWE